MKSTDKCMVPECKSMANTRGLCPSHYQFARKLVKEKRITWEKLEENKKTLPRKKPGIQNNIREYFLSK